MTDTHDSIIRKTLTPLKPILPDISIDLNIPADIRAVLFDIYGTLLISGTGDISLSSVQRDTLDMDRILKESNFEPYFKGCVEVIPNKLNRNIRVFHEKKKLEGVDYPEVEIRNIWKSVLKELWIEGSLVENPEDKPVDLLSLRHELSVNPVWPMPGFPEIIRSLRESGLHIGIVSNAQFYTPLIIEALAENTLEQIGFETDLCAWSYKILMAKPSKEIFRKPLDRLSKLGIQPSQVLYVGNDMLNDVSTASAAGCRTALFAGDRRSLKLREGDKRVKVKPDMIIKELIQLETLITQ
ncbi:MAG: HAD family hydrolase [Spirochaetes bacterium]|nr:MAG: HAD family hydrolase [Spirochaetota bacterium]RKX96683.1 MAG: HAD family hydrolase [Spirochaetota bacterium]